MVVPASTGLKCTAGTTSLVNVTPWSVTSCFSCCVSPATIMARSSSSNLSPASSAAFATDSLVISAPSAACAQRMPGSNVDASPMDAKYSMNARRERTGVDAVSDMQSPGGVFDVEGSATSYRRAPAYARARRAQRTQSSRCA